MLDAATSDPASYYKPGLTQLCSFNAECRMLKIVTIYYAFKVVRVFTLIISSQSRSLTENDYELLLQLDSPSVSRSSPSRVGVANHTSPPRVGVTNHTSPPRAGVANHTSPPRGGVSERVINALHVEPLDGDHPLIVGGANCEICGQEYNRGEWIRKLPCQHKVSTILLSSKKSTYLIF